MLKNPLISVVIPVYNVEEYIKEAIDSVIAQDIGFEDNIELILVDDGSKDRSGDICLQYSKIYPSNILYIKKRNGGVSTARNLGLSKSSGRYIHFLDGDDSISRDFYRQSARFLAQNENEVDFVAAKIKFFDEIIDSHPLNYKFDRDRVVDMASEPDSSLLHVITCLFNRESIADIQFDEDIQIAEDIKYISDVLLLKKRYGVISGPTYYYRKRTGGGSAIGGKSRNRNYYLKTPSHVYKHILDSWRLVGSPEVAEHTFLYDMSYSLQQSSQDVLSREEEDEYREIIKLLLAQCSDEVVVGHRFLSIHQKIYILKLKHGRGFQKYLSSEGSKIVFKNNTLYDSSDTRVFIDFLTHKKGNTYEIEGYIIGPTQIPQTKFYVDIKGKKTSLSWCERAQLEESFLGEVYKDGGAFRAEVDVGVGQDISVVLQTGKTQTVLPVDTGRFTRFGALKYTYRRDSERLLKRSRYKIEVFKHSFARHLYLEGRFWLQILLNWRLNTARSQLRKLRSRNLDQLDMKAKVIEILKPALIVGEAILMIPRALLLRLLYYIAKRLKKRPIWIVSDRGMAAGDNGEALFRYIMSQDDRPADVYFAIARKSKDYNRIKSIGPVLHQNDLHYKLKFLIADKIISSQADIETTNPFIRQLDHYVDLFNFDFIFLQHGIIRHNLSDWLNRYEKNIGLFITSAKKEYDSILKNPYYYKKEQVLLSGLPRYDYLESKPNRKVILAPTYRKRLVKQKTNKIGVRGYDEEFKSSEYREFYNSLINDHRLLKTMKNAGMKGEFYLHPVFSAQRKDFMENDIFKIMEFPYDYRAAFREGEILISDHSSVVFDFAYLKKPVVYAHFDVDTFFEGHSYAKSDFFSDEADGFGEVYYDYDSLVDGVADIIREGCVMKKDYISRVDRFFYSIDTNNSRRVYGALTRR